MSLIFSPRPPGMGSTALRLKFMTLNMVWLLVASFPDPLREVLQHHVSVDARRVDRALDGCHVVVGVRVALLARPEIRSRYAHVVEVTLVKGGRGVVGLGGPAEHRLARALQCCHDRRVRSDER